jgi:hypothetical protein
MSDEQELREAMASAPLVVLARDGVTPLFGFRCWPDDPEQPRAEAVLDALAQHAELPYEVYALLTDRDPPFDAEMWTEAWRLSDRAHVRSGTLGEVTDALIDVHRARDDNGA